MNTLTSRSGRALAAWTLLGLAAYALLPWYFLQQQSLWAALPGVWGGDATASGVVQAALHGRPWLWTGVAGLLIAGAGLLLPVGRAQGGVLVAGALLGLAGLLASGFAIGAPGWSYQTLEAWFGPLEHGQFGMGWGGFVAIACLVMLLGAGIARLGFFRGDRVALLAAWGRCYAGGVGMGRCTTAGLPRHGHAVCGVCRWRPAACLQHHRWLQRFGWHGCRVDVPGHCPCGRAGGR